jgi:hypothetical protein
MFSTTTPYREGAAVSSAAVGVRPMAFHRPRRPLVGAVAEEVGIVTGGAVPAPPVPPVAELKLPAPPGFPVGAVEDEVVADDGWVMTVGRSVAVVGRAVAVTVEPGASSPGAAPYVVGVATGSAEEAADDTGADGLDGVGAVRPDDVTGRVAVEATGRVEDDAVDVAPDAGEGLRSVTTERRWYGRCSRTQPRHETVAASSDGAEAEPAASTAPVASRSAPAAPAATRRCRTRRTVRRVRVASARVCALLRAVRSVSTGRTYGAASWFSSRGEPDGSIFTGPWAALDGAVRCVGIRSAGRCARAVVVIVP